MVEIVTVTEPTLRRRINMLFAGWEVRTVKNCDLGLENELRSFRLRVVSPTVCSPTVRVDSPTSHMSVRLRVKTCVTTVDSSTLCAIALGS